MRAVANFQPGVFRRRDVGGAAGKDFHFFVNPVQSVAGRHLFFKMTVDFEQVGDVAGGVFQLMFVKRPKLPVGQTVGLVQFDAENRFNQPFVTDAFAKTADHCRHLSVKQRLRDNARQFENDLDVLPAGVKHFGYVPVLHQRKEALQIDAFRQRVDDGGFFLRGDLDQAKQRKIGFFANKFQVYGNVRVFGQPLTEQAEILSVVDCLHGLIPLLVLTEKLNST